MQGFSNFARCTGRTREITCTGPTRLLHGHRGEWEWGGEGTRDLSLRRTSPVPVSCERRRRSARAEVRSAGSRVKARPWESEDARTHAAAGPANATQPMNETAPRSAVACDGDPAHHMAAAKTISPPTGWRFTLVSGGARCFNRSAAQIVFVRENHLCWILRELSAGFGV